MLAKRMRYESHWMISIIPVCHLRSGTRISFLILCLPDLLAAARTDKLEATQKELSDALIACALADENAAQLEKQ